MPKVDAQRKLESFIKSRRVVEIGDLFEVVQSTSRMTVFRRLRGIEYLCSCTHAGRYYTLLGIARFDSDGIWFYGDIGFSRNGSLKNTVAYLVQNGAAGKFHSDLERQVRVRVHNVLLDLVKSKRVRRVKFEGQYLYLSADEARSTEQVEQRDRLSTQVGRIPASLSEPTVIEILAEVIRQSRRHPRVSQVASALATRGLAITEDDVVSVFGNYDIEKKTPGSH